MGRKKARTGGELEEGEAAGGERGGVGEGEAGGGDARGSCGERSEKGGEGEGRSGRHASSSNPLLHTFNASLPALSLPLLTLQNRD